MAIASLGAAQALDRPVAQTTAGRSAERPLLVGTVSRADLREPPFAEWFDRQYSQYQPAEEAVRTLRAPLSVISMEVYFGTWCGDSRRQVPRLLRILDRAGFDERRLLMVGLSDRPMEFKKSPGNSEAKRLIHRTPTIVVLREGAEIGRIVETPTTSLEADLLAILEGHPPEPNYGAEAYVHRLFSSLGPAQAERALQAAAPEIAGLGDPGSLWHYAEFDLLKNNRPGDAKAVLDLHLKLNPRSVMGHVLMSEALAALGRKAEALEAARRALALEPGNERALRAVEAQRQP
jgi:tetratricopeptide (TPR) repeat protein